MGNIIYRQGGVTVEPYYTKVMDFGMEFETVDGKVLYRGLSLFDTIKNAYSGNVLCPEDKKEEMRLVTSARSDCCRFASMSLT